MRFPLGWLVGPSPRLVVPSQSAERPHCRAAQEGRGPVQRQTKLPCAVLSAVEQQASVGFALWLPFCRAVSGGPGLKSARTGPRTETTTTTLRLQHTVSGSGGTRFCVPAFYTTREEGQRRMERSACIGTAEGV